jgi:alkyldihydroxyacetonephosphate synthase
LREIVISRPTEPYPPLSWWGWGDPAQVPALPDSLRQLLVDALGVREPSPRPASPDEITLPPPSLPADVTTRLSAVVGEANAGADHEARVRHVRGKSTPDLLRLRAGDAGGAPDMVLCPDSHDQVQQLLELCSHHHVAVVPFGGGTTVVGGLEPSTNGFAGVIALDLRRMDRLLELDEESRLAVLEPGLRGPQAEDLLAQNGYTIGHFPQSFEYATLGGFAATRSSGQSSAGYGRFDDLVLALKVATPAGPLALGRAPKSAAGPDLRQLVLGSEGALGVITELTMQVRSAPEHRVYEGWRFESFWKGVDTIRSIVQDGPRPTVLRLSDEAETALNLARPAELGAGAGGSLAIVGYEGTADDVAARHGAVSKALAAAGADLDQAAGDSWSRDRYRGPYFRDALLDAGTIVETLETVTFWSNLRNTYNAVSTALRDALTEQGTPPVILCHLSHVYPSGASLYFTVGCAALPEPIAQWRAAKAAASEAIIAAGASITHHHGVGRDHLEWYEREIGALGVEALRAVKARLDPAGILNPGILIPPPR